MAKILGSNGLTRMRNTYFKNEGNFTHSTLDNTLSDSAYGDNEQIKAGQEYGTYKMKDLYPDTYATMTSVPEGLDVSKLRIADGLFQGCTALESVDGLNLSNAISADHIFEDCTALKSVNGIVAPKCESWKYAFQGCKALTEIGEWDTSVVKNFYGMFLECESLPETFPWTLDISNATQPFTGYTAAIFGYTSVRNVTLKQNWRYNIKARKFQYIIGEYFREYIRHNDIDTTADSITIPYTIGNDTYSVIIPTPSDWVNESYYDSWRKNMELFFSQHISGCSEALYSRNAEEYTYTDTDGTEKTGTKYTIKTYEEDPTNYQDVITYEERINRGTSSASVTWSDSTRTNLPAKTLMFKKIVTHILKNAVNITWA